VYFALFLLYSANGGMKCVPTVLFALALSVRAEAEQRGECTDKDAELSPDASSYYVPSRCTSLWIDGDHPRKDMIIEALEMHPSLRKLSLARDPFRARAKGGMEADDMLVLLDVLPSTNIEDLDLAFNVEIGDEGVSLLCDHLTEIKLKYLNLQTTGLTDVGLLKIAETIAKDHTPLESLNIARNIIGKVGEVNDVLLEAVRSHSNIRHLNDEGTELKEIDNVHGNAIRTILKGECFASDWGAWSKCAGECGETGEVRRERAILHRPHERHLAADAACPHELEDWKPCKVRCKGNWKTGMKAVPLAEKIATMAKEAKPAAEPTTKASGEVAGGQGRRSGEPTTKASGEVAGREGRRPKAKR